MLMLDLKRLRVLRSVSEHGSFSAAADDLYLSQSAVSQQIANLEAEVGEPPAFNSLRHDLDGS